MTKEKRDWRELCAAVAKETDSERLFELTEELIVALDEGKSLTLSRTCVDKPVVDTTAEAELLPTELSTPASARDYIASPS